MNVENVFVKVNSWWVWNLALQTYSLFSYGSGIIKRMRMKDNQYQWFRASAEVIRRLDGSASRIAGIFINIDAEKKEIMQAQKSAAFHRAFTKANLCEYYVNLEANTFDTFKVEPSLMTVFEQSHTWRNRGFRICHDLSA